jgi:hypothetical protein
MHDNRPISVWTTLADPIILPPRIPKPNSQVVVHIPQRVSNYLL